MKRNLLFAFLLMAGICQAQSVVQSVNSGALITASSSVSIGEIVVNPVNPNQSSSGLIGILAQVGSTLEVAQFGVAQNITVYPNPTVARINFQSDQNLSGEKVSIYNNAGQLALENKIDSDHSLDLASLPTGVYLIQFSNKKFQSFKIIKR